MKVGIISLKELEYRLDSGAPMRLIDLRKPEEYDAGHLEGAANIPFDQIPRRSFTAAAAETAFWPPGWRQGAGSPHILSPMGLFITGAAIWCGIN